MKVQAGYYAYNPEDTPEHSRQIRKKFHDGMITRRKKNDC